MVPALPLVIRSDDDDDDAFGAGVGRLTEEALLLLLFQWSLHMKFNSKLLKTWKIAYVNHKGFTSSKSMSELSRGLLQYIVSFSSRH